MPKAVNLALLDLLVDLSTSASLHTQFGDKKNRKGIYAKYKLNAAAMKALDESDSVAVAFEVNQQIADGGRGLRRQNKK